MHSLPLLQCTGKCLDGVESDFGMVPSLGITVRVKVDRLTREPLRGGRSGPLQQ